MNLSDDDKALLDKVALDLIEAAVCTAQADTLTELARTTLWDFADKHWDDSELQRLHLSVETDSEEYAKEEALRLNPAYKVESVADTTEELEAKTTTFTVFMVEDPTLKKFEYKTPSGIKIGRTVGADVKHPEFFDTKGLIRDHPEAAEGIVTLVQTKRWRPGQEQPDVEDTFEIEPGSLESYVASHPEQRSLLAAYITPGRLKTKWMPKPKPPEAK